MPDIKLTPEMLLEQSNEMTNLQTEYESLFQQVKNALEGINQSWSTNIASNFSGKITSAQNSFSSILNMFSNGSNAAKASATRLGTPSSWISRLLTDEDLYSGLDNIHSKINKSSFDRYKEFAEIPREEIAEMFPDSIVKDETKAYAKTASLVAKGIEKVTGIALPGTSLIDPLVRTGLETKHSLDNGGNGMGGESWFAKENSKTQEWLSNEFVNADQSGNTVAKYAAGAAMGLNQMAYNIVNTATNATGSCIETIGYIPKAQAYLYESTGLDKSCPSSYRAVRYFENGTDSLKSTLFNAF